MSPECCDSQSHLCSNVGLFVRSTSSVCCIVPFAALVRRIVVVRAVAVPGHPPHSGLSAQWTVKPPRGPDKVSFQEGRRGRWRNFSRCLVEVSQGEAVAEWNCRRPVPGHVSSPSKTASSPQQHSSRGHGSENWRPGRSWRLRWSASGRSEPSNGHWNIDKRRVGTSAGFGGLPELFIPNQSRTSMPSWCPTRCRRSRPTTMPEGSKPAHWPLLQSIWSL